MADYRRILVAVCWPVELSSDTITPLCSANPRGTNGRIHTCHFSLVCNSRLTIGVAVVNPELQKENQDPKGPTLPAHEGITLSLPQNTPLQNAIKELARLEAGERDQGALEQILKTLSPEDGGHLLNAVDHLIRRLEGADSERPIHPPIIYGLFNANTALYSWGFIERAELNYERLLPLSERCENKGIAGWCHVTVGTQLWYGGMPEEAEPHFARAWELIKNSPSHIVDINALRIYEFFARKHITDANGEWAHDTSIGEAEKWCDRIIKTVNHPSNRQAAVTSGKHVLEALYTVARVRQYLEEVLGDSGASSIQTFERLVMHAGLSPDPIALPQARLWLATAYMGKGRHEDALSEGRAALNELEPQTSQVAKSLSTVIGQIVHRLTIDSGIDSEETAL